MEEHVDMNVSGEDRRTSGRRFVAIGTILAVISVVLGMPFLLFVSAVILLVGFSRIPQKPRG